MRKLNILLISCALLFVQNSYAKSSSQLHKKTIVVKSHDEVIEDGFTFTTKKGEEFFIYNEGGASPIKGEQYVIEGKTICLNLDSDENIKFITKGKCK